MHEDAYTTVAKFFTEDEQHGLIASLLDEADDRLSREEREQVKKIATEIAKEHLKGEALEKMVLGITRNAVSQLFKWLYVRRSTWRDELVNKAA